MVLEYRAGPCAAPVALIRSEEYRDDSQLARLVWGRDRRDRGVLREGFSPVHDARAGCRLGRALHRGMCGPHHGEWCPVHRLSGVGRCSVRTCRSERCISGWRMSMEGPTTPTSSPRPNASAPPNSGSTTIADVGQRHACCFDLCWAATLRPGRNRWCSSWGTMAERSCAGLATASGCASAPHVPATSRSSAVAREQRIGVDLERVRPDLEFVAIARRALGDEVADHLEAERDEERAGEFFRAWVREEARGKCRGTGLVEPDDVAAKYSPFS